MNAYKLLLALIFLSCLCTPHAFATPRLKVGLSVPLTGPNATFGTDLKNIIQYANRVIADNKYDLVIEDDHCDGKSALSVAQKLVHVDRVSAVFFACDTAALTAAPGEKGDATE